MLETRRETPARFRAGDGVIIWFPCIFDEPRYWRWLLLSRETPLTALVIPQSRPIPDDFVPLTIVLDEFGPVRCYFLP